MSDIVIPTGAFGEVDKTAAEKMATEYKGALSQTRTDLAKANADRGDVTQRNLAAIDEAISGLKNSRYTGALGLNPSVSAAMAAGFLKTTPGVSSTFAGELGNAMGNAAPVLAGLEKGDRDSFALLAELQRKRGEFESEPYKERQKFLEEREKAESTGLRTIEAAGLRGTTADQRAAAAKTSAEEKAQAKIEAEKRAAVAKAQNDANADVEKQIAGADFVSPEDKIALYRDALNERIRIWNAQNSEVQIQMPDTYDPATHGKRAAEVRSKVEAKGKGEYNQKQLQTLRSNAESFVAKQYPEDIWQHMPQKDKEALIERELHRTITDHNDQAGKDNTRIQIVPPTRKYGDADIAAADAAAERAKNIGQPTDDELAASSLPITDRPKLYSSAMTYKARQELEKREREVYTKALKPYEEEAAKLASKQEDVARFQAAYAGTMRKGLVGGKVPALGDAEAQIMEKIVASFQLNNFPQGQGAVSEGERTIIKDAGANRQLEPYAVQVILDAYTTASQRAADYVEFSQRWFAAHRTHDGAGTAWRRYLESDEGKLIVVDKNNKIQKNPNHVGWKQYFDKENDAGMLEDFVETDPATGASKIVKRKRAK